MAKAIGLKHMSYVRLDLRQTNIIKLTKIPEGVTLFLQSTHVVVDTPNGKMNLRHLVSEYVRLSGAYVPNYQI